MDQLHQIFLQRIIQQLGKQAEIAVNRLLPPATRQLPELINVVLINKKTSTVN
jgi:hypothetical protein